MEKMKKFGWLLLTLLAALPFTACNDDEGGYPYNYVYGIITTVHTIGEEDYYFERDNGQTLYPSEKPALYEAREGSRAIIYFDLLESIPDYDYNIRLFGVDNIYTGAARVVTTQEELDRRWPELAPLSAAQEHALGDGPAVYYTVPGWQGSIGFIAAVHGKFCASCNRVRLTSQGFLRPCLASETGCDLRTLLRGGAADEELLQAIRETIWSKPREHHFGDNSMPATRGMYRIGG